MGVEMEGETAAAAATISTALCTFSSFSRLLFCLFKDVALLTSYLLQEESQRRRRLFFQQLISSGLDSSKKASKASLKNLFVAFRPVVRPFSGPFQVVRCITSVLRHGRFLPTHLRYQSPYTQELFCSGSPFYRHMCCV